MLLSSEAKPAMSDPAAVKLKRMLDGSGFPFQLALEEAVRSLQASSGWRVTGREYPWRTASASGYMELVLSNGKTHLAVECKRSRRCHLDVPDVGREAGRAVSRTNLLDRY